MAMIPAWGIALMVSGGGMGLQMLFAPRPKQTPVDKGKFDDIRIQGSDYGSFIPRVRGQARFAGNLVFSDGIDHEIINSPSDGGKGAPASPSERTHVYRSSMGIVLCRGEIVNIIRMWADADLVIGNSEVSFGSFEAESGTLTGGASSYVDATASGGDAVENLGNGGKVVFNTSSIPDPVTPRPDPDEIYTQTTKISFFYKCAADKVATIDTDVTTAQDITLPNSNSEWTSYDVHITGFPDSISYEYAAAATANLDRITIEKYYQSEPVEVRPGYRITGIVNPNIAYPTNLDDPSAYYNYPLDDTKDGGTGIYSVTGSDPTTAIRVYSGTETQTADSAIISWLDARYGTGEGVLRTSAMRGLCWVMFEDYSIKNGRPPNFTVEVDAGEPLVNDILEDLFEDVGIAIADCDLTATAALTQTGWIEHTKASRRQYVEQLERYHQFRLAEIDGEIVSILDSGTSVVTFSADDLRAHEIDDEWPKYDVETILKEEHLLPREIRFSIMNPQAEYHNETVTAQLFAGIAGTETKEYTFPIVDSLANARLGAEKAILKEYAENVGYEFYAMPEYAKYSVGDVITVPVGGADCLMRIEKKQMQLPIGKVRFQCVSTGYTYPSVVFQDDATALASRAASQYAVVPYPRNTVIFVIQSAPIREQERGKLGVYLAICGRGRGQAGNSALYREYAADNYVLESIIDSSSPVGLLAASMATGGGVNLDVWFFDDISLESVDAVDLLRNPTLNLIRVDDEWIQYEDATALTLEDNSPYRSKWRLQTLTRGLFGTTDNSHAVNEYVAAVTPALRFYELEAADIGETVNLKAVTGGQNIEVAPISSFTFAPVSAYTITNASTDRTFDANATSINELADVVATIVDDLNL